MAAASQKLRKSKTAENRKSSLDRTLRLSQCLGMLNPAKRVIQICGGYDAVAEMTCRSAARVRRWEYPRARGGTDGLIPADCQKALLATARARGIDLRPEHFFDWPDAPSDAEGASLASGLRTLPAVQMAPALSQNSLTDTRHPDGAEGRLP
ncbi:hypothetical protein [Rhodobacter capsulatus]|jgi:hypothetical protein|nr:hypothetical protein [Rhodobacter capsulatus]MDS0927452.1 hypothetical protein [Rhodobacter capsulatus]